MRAYPVPAAFVFVGATPEEFVELRRKQPGVIAVSDLAGYLPVDAKRLPMYAKSVRDGYVVVHDGTDVPVVLTIGVETPQAPVLSLEDVQRLGIDIGF